MGMDQYVRRVELIPTISKEDSLILLSLNGVRGENYANSENIMNSTIFWGQSSAQTT